MVFNPHAHLENPELAEQNAKLNQEYDSINVTAEDLDEAKSESPFSSQNWKTIEEQKKEARQIAEMEWEDNDLIDYDPTESLIESPDMEATWLEIIIPEKLNDIPEFKTVESLYAKWHINEKKYSNFIDKLEKTNKWEEKILIKNFIKNNVSDKNLKEKLNKTIDWKNKINENNFEQSDFYKSAKDKNIDINLDFWVWHIEIMMAENYVEIPENNNSKNTKEKKWTETKQEAIKRTIDVTASKIIIKNWNDFKKNKDVVDIVWDIKDSSDLNSKYKYLKKLWELDLIDDAKKWWTKSLKEKNKANSKKENIEKKIKELQSFAEEKLDENNIERIKEIGIKLQNELDNSTKTLDNIEKELQKVEWQIKSWESERITESVEK